MLIFPRINSRKAFYLLYYTVILLLNVTMNAIFCSAERHEVILEHYCKTAYVLPCPDSGDPALRAGRLRFQNVPKLNCTVEVTTPSNCTTLSAIYLHIPVSNLDKTHTIRVYDSSEWKQPLLKIIPGGISPNLPKTTLASVAHVLSRYHKVPALKITMDLGPRRKDNPHHQFGFDYTILTMNQKLNEIYCKALEGYIPRAIMCNQDASARVTCPDEYTQHTGISSVKRVQPCLDSGPDGDPTIVRNTDDLEITNNNGISSASVGRSGTRILAPVKKLRKPLTDADIAERIYLQNAKGTVRYALRPLRADQELYRIGLGKIILYVTDRNVQLESTDSTVFEEQIRRSPAHSLTHPNCSQSTHWISFSSRRAGDLLPFIKFGYGYEMENNVLFHFSSLPNIDFDPLIGAIESVVLADGVAVVDHVKLKPQPTIADLSPVLVEPDAPRMRHPLIRLRPRSSEYDTLIAGILEDVNAFTLTPEELAAINYSLEIPGCTLHKILAGKMRAGRKSAAYIRVPGPRNLLRAPGQEMVMEIWPKGHYSAVHNHGNTSGVFKILQGSVTFEWYNPIVNMSYEDPVLIKTQTFHTGNITWMRSDLYQTHRLRNERTDIVSILAQAYRYEDDEELVKEDYFYYVVPDSPYLGMFLPHVDIGLSEIIRPEGRIIQEYRTKNCGS
ncbi:uncharacterized protein LOC129585267 isoform X2 [Paramacrobiotus metropolitanus]|uniref:uncharacterized protein LOC129585267 isoform X2 n=1 Tax=Paramacrobiotus metropolitanus TaxID=2943436 RepID=UPI002445C5E0|nr:uncharacterized protein LOC129585267 isoform X2 [Paramacrobiotus metropolitanus]